ncbi:hypothetical protein [Polyangium jinanense]|uniref:Uncharacterized protein n=1 Tax=Polyangium jinanense TaxID=2829994 RepID=A0A9X4AZV2_9BACT|nr:hypothetical protein [Polyangium jinanense]MDC3961809.1 hypothetical protein [Polyangium jinanense]MDC3988537.1 hypothetical protein [Polyangium jinanense]
MSFLRLLGLVGLSAWFVGCGNEVAETSFVDPGTALWARRFGRGSYVEPVGLVGVASGGVVVSGRFYGDVDLGGGTLPGPGNNYQAYVARYDGEGNHVYSRAFGAEFAEMSNDVAVFPDGSALIVGTFGWPVDLDGITLPWGGSDDAFVAKLDPAGKVVWARTFGGAGVQRGTAVAAMPDGGAVVAGQTLGEVDLGIGEPQDTSFGSFVVRLDAKGASSWSQMLKGGGEVVTVEDIAVQGERIAVVGQFMNAMVVGFEDQLVQSNGFQDGYVVTYDSDGKPLWFHVMGAAGYYDDARSVAFTADGGLVITGDVEGNVDLGGGFIQAVGEYDTNTYLLELDAASNHRRSVLYGGDGWDRGHGVAVTAGGGVIITGEMAGRMSFGEASLAASEAEIWGDAFVAELDADRNPVFLRRFGGSEMQMGQRAAVDGEGRVYIAGTAVGAVDFGLGPTPSSGYYETFLVALAP